MLKQIFILILSLFLLAQSAFSAVPRLILAASGDGWRDPIYSPDGNSIAFTDAAQQELFVLVRDESAPRSVARGEGIGRRFVFEPDGERIAFRLRSHALPGKPERLLSSSIYSYDPVHHSNNMEGDLFGPYFFDGRVWYRTSLIGPFFDYKNNVRASGPYWDPVKSRMLALNGELDTVFVTGADQQIAGMEISPDGAWIAAVESQPARQLLLIRIENGQTLTIPGVFAPNWSGDSRSVICASNNADGGSELRLVKVPSGESISVLKDPQFQPESPALDANGKNALFVSKGALYEMPLP